MMITGVLGCGTKFRRALRREPLDIQQRMIVIRERIERGQTRQAYNLLQSTEADHAMKARLYERISRQDRSLAEESREKAKEHYIEAGQQERAKYLDYLR